MSFHAHYKFVYFFRTAELHIESSTHQHHNSKKQTLSESEITAQVILFFVAG